MSEFAHLHTDNRKRIGRRRHIYPGLCGRQVPQLLKQSEDVTGERELAKSWRAEGSNQGDWHAAQRVWCSGAQKQPTSSQE
jgi:hypothetical protein